MKKFLIFFFIEKKKIAHQWSSMGKNLATPLILHLSVIPSRMLLCGLITGAHHPCLLKEEGTYCPCLCSIPTTWPSLGSAEHWKVNKYWAPVLFLHHRHHSWNLCLFLCLHVNLWKVHGEKGHLHCAGSEEPVHIAQCMRWIQNESDSGSNKCWGHAKNTGSEEKAQWRPCSVAVLEGFKEKKVVQGSEGKGGTWQAEGGIPGRELSSQKWHKGRGNSLRELG